jgi:hypothetical protein
VFSDYVPLGMSRGVPHPAEVPPNPQPPTPTPNPQPTHTICHHRSPRHTTLFPRTPSATICHHRPTRYTISRHITHKCRAVSVQRVMCREFMTYLERRRRHLLLTFPLAAWLLTRSLQMCTSTHCTPLLLHGCSLVHSKCVRPPTAHPHIRFTHFTRVHAHNSHAHVPYPLHPRRPSLLLLDDCRWWSHARWRRPCYQISRTRFLTRFPTRSSTLEDCERFTRCLFVSH